MKRHLDTHNNFGLIWSAKTKNFDVCLYLEEDPSFVWDGDDQPDEDGETIQDKINSGDLVAFDSKLCVELDGEEIGTAYLGGSVYEYGKTHEFMQSGYVRSMLEEACNEARAHMQSRPTLRAGKHL